MTELKDRPRITLISRIHERGITTKRTANTRERPRMRDMEEGQAKDYLSADYASLAKAAARRADLRRLSIGLNGKSSNSRS